MGTHWVQRKPLVFPGDSEGSDCTQHENQHQDSGRMNIRRKVLQNGETVLKKRSIPTATEEATINRLSGVSWQQGRPLGRML